MNKVLCIYPEDPTTSFLEPVYALCLQYGAIGLKGDPTEDDDYFDCLSALSGETDTIIFLGHGSSSVLYGINFNQLFCAENKNVDILRQKRLILFACHSCGFIKYYGLTTALGFGEIPTSDYDVKNGNLHGLLIKKLTRSDIEYIKNAIVKIWRKSLEETKMRDLHRFYRSFSYNTICAIVRCLKGRECPNFRLIANVLYYLKYDMLFIK